MKLNSTLSLLLLFFFSVTAKSQSTTVVISQVYGGGGATSGTPTYLYDYIELFNLTNAPIDLSNYSLQYGASSATSNFGGSNANRFIIPEGTMIGANQYLLIQTASAGTVGAELPVTPDFVTTALAMSATNGKVILLSDSTRINCGGNQPCVAVPIPNMVDQVGYGAVTTGNEAPSYEGTASANNGTSINNRSAVVRKGNGCQDTDDNGADFDLVEGAVPRNSQSPANMCVIPVKLSSFNILQNNGNVKLTWTTEQEFNSSYFLIERSANGTSWTSIATVSAYGFSGTTKNYSYADNAPLTGLNYYRLKQVDLNGRIEYSSIKRALIDTKNIALVSPNPAKDFINVYITKENNVPSTITVSDINGKQIRSTVSNDAFVQLSTAGFNKGVYFIKVMNDKKVTTQKVIVQ